MITFLLLSLHAASLTAAAACPPDMVAVDGFCMDRFEAPNAQGLKPIVAATAPEAVRWCAERGKTLCTEAQWLRACEGPQHRLYPYGNTYRAQACNDGKEWRSPDWRKISHYPKPDGQDEVARLDQSESSGSRAGCVSSEGVYDLTGNVAEWVTRSFANHNNYDQVLKGCYWAGCYGGSHPSCRFVNPAHPGTFRTYEAGFRCCLDSST